MDPKQQNINQGGMPVAPMAPVGQMPPVNQVQQQPMVGDFLERTLIEFGVTPGVESEFYQGENLEIDITIRDEKLTFGKEIVTLSNKYKNYILLMEALHGAGMKALRSIDNAMNSILDDGAFKVASDTVALAIAETIKFTTPKYPLDAQSLTTLVDYSKKSVEDLKGFVSATYDHYRDESIKTKIEKSSRDQVMAAESIARASEVKSSTTTISGGVSISGYGYGVDYGTYSFGRAYGGGGFSGVATTTYHTGMSHLSDDLASDAVASANIEAKDQARVGSSAADSIHDHCFKALNGFFETLAQMFTKAHPDLIAQPDHEYGHSGYWVNVAESCTEQDVEKYNEALQYYGSRIEDIWQLYIGQIIYDFLLANDFKGVYEGKPMDCYLKAMRLKEFETFDELSKMILDTMVDQYGVAAMRSEYDAKYATKLAVIKDAAMKCPYFTENDKEEVKKQMSGTGKTIAKQRLNSMSKIAHVMIIAFALITAIVMTVIPCVRLFQAGELEDLGLDFGLEYLWAVAGACGVALGTLTHMNEKKISSAIGSTIGGFIGGTVLFFIISVICVMASGRMEW